MATHRDSAAILRRQLMWSLQALAAPADVQVTFYPDFTVKADELALDFDHWYMCSRSNFGSEWTEPQRAALVALDTKLGAMSRLGPEFTDDLWLEPELASNVKWAEVCCLALTALRFFGWPADCPPRAPEDRGSWYIA